VPGREIHIMGWEMLRRQTFVRKLTHGFARKPAIVPILRRQPLRFVELICGRGDQKSLVRTSWTTNERTGASIKEERGSKRTPGVSRLLE
jgi:hypothetical protein